MNGNAMGCIPVRSPRERPGREPVGASAANNDAVASPGGGSILRPTRITQKRLAATDNGPMTDRRIPIQLTARALITRLQPVAAIPLLAGSVFVLIGIVILLGRWKIPAEYAAPFFAAGLLAAIPYASALRKQ